MKKFIVSLGFYFLSLNLFSAKLIPQRVWGYDQNQSLAMQKLQEPFYGALTKKQAKNLINKIPRDANEEGTFAFLVSEGLKEKPALFLSLILRNQKYSLLSISWFLKYYAELQPEKSWQDLLTFLDKAFCQASKKKPLVLIKAEIDSGDDDDDDEGYETESTEPWDEEVEPCSFEKVNEYDKEGINYHVFKLIDNGIPYEIEYDSSRIKGTTFEDIKTQAFFDLELVEEDQDSN